MRACGGGERGWSCRACLQNVRLCLLTECSCVCVPSAAASIAKDLGSVRDDLFDWLGVQQSGRERLEGGGGNSSAAGVSADSAAAAANETAATGEPAAAEDSAAAGASGGEL